MPRAAVTSFIFDGAARVVLVFRNEMRVKCVLMQPFPKCVFGSNIIFICGSYCVPKRNVFLQFSHRVS